MLPAVTAIMAFCVNALSAYSMRSRSLLFGYNFIELIENAFVPGKMKRLVPNFKKMQDMILLIPFYKL